MSVFSKVRGNKLKRNKFDLSHERKLSFNMGDLVPVYLEEIIPGDGFYVDTEVMLRLAPILAPIMHRVNVWMHYFFVPNRIVWNEWEDFITGGEDGTDTPVMPSVSTLALGSTSLDLCRKGTLWDYFGLPPYNDEVVQNFDVGILPFRAYTEIYNEFYRDQNVVDKIDFTKASGSVFDDEWQKIAALRKRSWEKDYFTSCLPFPQRGDEVGIPVNFSYKDISDVYQFDGTDVASGNVTADTVGGSPGQLRDANAEALRVENLNELATEFNINDLRRSSAIQRWLEKSARGGSRYAEQLLNFFGVYSDDARLQRPEYLGGGKQNVVISEVLQTSEAGTTPQGNMAGHGISVGTANSFKKKQFKEHGYVIGIMSVLPRTAYQQGIPKTFLRTDKFDYYFNEFAHLGEQAVLNKELYVDWANNADQNNTFGYQSRYAEYKFHNSYVAGDFRDALAYWHMGRIFSSAPALNQSFIEADPTHRIFANTTPEDHKLWCHVYNRVNALRPMPYFSDPRLS